jgi:chloride channel protein, CIC family
MRTNVVALPGDATIEEANELIRPGQRPHGQHLFPIIDDRNQLLGVVSRNRLSNLFEESRTGDSTDRLKDIASGDPTVALPDRAPAGRCLQNGGIGVYASSGSRRQ